MGLLEKAKQKKETGNEIENNSDSSISSDDVVGDVNKSDLLEKIEEKENESEKLKDTEQDIISDKKSSGLLEVAKQKKEEKYERAPTVKEKSDEFIEKQAYEGIHLKDDGTKEVIEEKKGFGYNGLATRRIVFDHKINEYVYEVSEPKLNESEIEIKDELSHLFKMLADINVTNTDKEEKKKYLDETLEQIIIDNNIKFIPRKKKNPKDKGSLISGLKGTTKKEKKPLDNTSGKNKEKKKFSLKKPVENVEEKSVNETDKKKYSFKKTDKGEKKNFSLNVKRELSPQEKKSKEKIFYHIFREYLGYNRIDVIMEDDGIEDISCDGPHVPIFIYHKTYDETTTNIKFKDDKELNSFVVRLAQVCGKQISIYSPIVDGKLPDGSRLQTTLANTVTQGSTFTIRKFKDNPLTPIDLIGFKSISIEMAAYFWMAIEHGASILFCGGTASGKTTALNALSLFIPSQHKIISIEDTREVNLPHKNWISGTTRAGFSSSDEKTGKDIDMFDLIRAALRQRPKVVMVGEVRGKEAYSLFQAMATGHTAYSTVHASTIHTLIQRLESPPISLPRALLTSLEVIVFQNAINMGGKYVRRMTSVTEIIKLDPDSNQLIFMEPFRWVSKTDDRFESSGTSKIMNNICLENSWTEERLEEEIENRVTILKWMCKNNIKDYKDVGRIVADYSKYPDELLKKTREELKI